MASNQPHKQAKSAAKADTGEANKPARNRQRAPGRRVSQARFDATSEPKESWFVPEAGREDLARYGGLDAAVSFIERRLGGRGAGSPG